VKTVLGEWDPQSLDYHTPDEVYFGAHADEFAAAA
jgi:hypothetical protein